MGMKLIRQYGVCLMLTVNILGLLCASKAQNNLQPRLGIVYPPPYQQYYFTNPGYYRAEASTTSQLPITSSRQSLYRTTELSTTSPVSTIIPTSKSPPSAP